MKNHNVLPASRLLRTADAAAALTLPSAVMAGNQGLHSSRTLMPEGIPKELRTFTVRAIYEATLMAQIFVLHDYRRQRSRRTIDPSVTNPRISEWPMPVTDTEALSVCLSAPKLCPCRKYFAS